MKLTHLITSALALTAAATTAQAVTLVSWGLAETDTSVKATGFDDSIVDSNADFTNNGSSYTGTDSTNGTYYAGFDAANKSTKFSVSSTANTAFQVQNNASYDRIRVVDDGTANAVTETMIIWEDQNWSNAIGSETLSSFSADGFKSGNNSQNQYSFLVQTTAGWYSTAATTWSGTPVLSVADVTTETWHDFTAMSSESTAASFALASNIGSVTMDTIDFNDVIAVGFYHLGDSNGSSASGLQIGHFEATAVPEPSAYALIGGLCALGFVMARRRQ